jgi:2-oxoglutarate ferredoxin oxidoreductase subunit delta
MAKARDRPKFGIIVDGRLCKKCGICVYICPKNVFSLSRNLRVNSDLCSGCGQCEIFCPDFAVEVVRISENGDHEGTDSGE